MPLKEAESCAPDISYRADAPADYAQAIEPVLEVLGTLSPTVEWSTDPARMAAAARHDRAARYAVFLDGAGLSLLYGSEARLAHLIARDVLEQTGHAARVGIADGRFAALRAAMMVNPSPPTGRPSPPIPLPQAREGQRVGCSPLSHKWERGAGGVRDVLVGGVRVPPGGDAAFLARLPVAMLPLPAEACARVFSLGARTLHEFARLPANALRHRFGPDGVVARALAAGHDEGPLRPRPLPLQLHDALDLEWVETSLDRLLFLFKRLADRLSVRLEHHGLGCGRLRVRWLLDASGLETGDDTVDPDPGDRAPSAAVMGGVDDGSVVSTVRLAEPAGSSASLLEHLRWHVEGLRPEMFRDPISGQLRGVRGIVVEAEELASLGGRQLALLPGEDGRTAEPARLLSAERALARLQARWGEDAVRQAELVASRRPEQAFRWRAPAIQIATAVATTAPRRRRRPSPPAPLPQAGEGRRIGGSPLSCVRHGDPAAAAGSPCRTQERGVGGVRGVSSTKGIRGPLWLAGPPQDVTVDRGGRLPNGRRRHGTIVQGERSRRIVRAAGPWRLVERWAADPIARDAYHVVLSDNAACWLVHDRLTDRWQLYGTFD